MRPYLKITGKRVNFINIQHGHGISCEGYTAPVVRTGYEQVIPQRTSKKFAYTAKQDGRVLSLNDKGIIIQYGNGKTVGIELGRVYGKTGSLTFPFDIVTHLKPNQTFKRGQVIAYNTKFFTRDFLNPDGVVYKGSMPVMVAVMESASTYEDSCSISRRIADKLTTELSEVVPIIAKRDEAIHHLVKVGQYVKSSDHLCVIQDEVTANSTLFEEDTLDSLRSLAANTPRAGVEGRVEQIEVIYNDELDNLSPSLKALAIESDKALKARLEATGSVVYTGRAPEKFRVGGDPLVKGTVLIRITITRKVGMGNGDKSVFGNQLKTIVGEVLDEPMVTEFGVEVDAKFGSKSIGNRIVHSPYLIGTSSILSKLIAKRAVDAYFGGGINS